MALLVTPRMCFLHAPKTGGRWAMGAMLAAGVPAVRPDGVSGHATLDQAREFADRFTFAFVRHPLDFWRSYWAFRMRDGWDPEAEVDAAVGSPNFATFIDGVTEQFPGYASSMCEAFIRSPDREIDFIGRFERLADDLVTALRFAGEPCDEAVLRAHPAENASDYAQLPVLYNRDAAQRLAECERHAIDRFYYWDPVPARLVREGGGCRRVPELLAARIVQSEVAARDAKAALAIARRAATSEHAVSMRRQAQLDEAQAALASLRASRLLRWSRPLRIAWYRIRPHRR